MRGLAPDAADDLFTLLWTEEFQYVDMRFAEFVQDFGTGDMVPGAKYAAGASFATEVKQDLAGALDGEGPGGVAAAGEGVEEGEATDAAGEAGGAVDTRHAAEGRGGPRRVRLDAVLPRRRRSRHAERRPQARVLPRPPRGLARRPSTTSSKGEGSEEVREEILGVLEALFPSMLNAGEFRASAAVLRETRVLGERSPDLSPAHKTRLVQFIEQLSEPAIVGQLMQALDEGTGRPSDADITELLRELRPKALATLVEWTPRLTSAPVRALVEAAVQHLASAHQGELLRLLRSGDAEALPGAIELAGRLKLEGAVAGLGDVYGRADATLRLAATEALIQIGTPGALVLLERAVGDDDRGVRVAALKALSARGYKGALKRVEEVVQGKGRKDLDFNERRAFFEAYGAIAGAGGLGVLRDLIVRRGFFRRKQSARRADVRRTRVGQDRHRRRPRRAGVGGRRQRPPGAQRRDRGTAGGGRVTHDPLSAEHNLRHDGRSLLLSFYAALRSLKLYPLENTTVQKALDDLLAAGAQLLGTEEEVEIRVSGDFLFVNDTRLRLELDNYASFSQVLGLLRTFEVGTLRIVQGVERREWQALLSIFLSLGTRRRGGEPLRRVDRPAASGPTSGTWSSSRSPPWRSRRTPPRRARWPSGPTPRASRSPRTWSTASAWAAPPTSRR